MKECMFDCMSVDRSGWKPFENCWFVVVFGVRRRSLWFLEVLLLLMFLWAKDGPPSWAVWTLDLRVGAFK